VALADVGDDELDGGPVDAVHLLRVPVLQDGLHGVQERGLDPLQQTNSQSAKTRLELNQIREAKLAQS
jgi:hypothetical protein